MPRVLIPLPDRDFDVTEVAVPWRLLTRSGHRVEFCTEKGGAAPAADPLLLSGVLFGQLGAEPEPCAFYRELEADPGFRAPHAWDAIEFGDYDGLLLPSGHAPGMRQYLGSDALQRRVAGFFLSGRPVGAICHGVLVLARSIDPATGKSVLRDAARQLERGPIALVRRDSAQDADPAFVVVDGSYISARWPGDAYGFAHSFERLLASDGRGRDIATASLESPG